MKISVNLCTPEWIPSKGELFNSPWFLSPLILATWLLTSCALSPTGKPQLLLFPESQMAEMGAAAFQETKKETPETQDTKQKKYVTCIANAITKQVDPSTNWEVTVFKSDQVNAFALPGGKIGVYTGLLKVADNQDQLAAVVGHEVAHVIAHHGNARVSTSYATGAGLQVVQVLAGGASPARQQLLGLLGVGAQVGVLLPYGRSQESEADILGLDYMAMAGFDPRQSIQLWMNMAANAQGKEPSEFLSTHPSNSTRINDLNEHMPEALMVYETARGAGRKPNC